MADVVHRSGIYGPRQYAKIVRELLEHWAIGSLTGLSALGREAQEKLMKIPARLDKLAAYVESKTKPRTFAFAFLYNRPIAL
jgi:acyl-[acyl-carrier-protein] desaturase